MISLNKFHGRLGNQLFQYAYIRTQANRLATKFYCPKWPGDEIFELADDNERANESPAKFYYKDTSDGYSRECLEIKDGTSIDGFFQSHKYFEKKDVWKWYSFKEKILEEVREKYKNLDLKESTAIHIRLGDYTSPQLTFYTPRKSYFKRALSLMDQKKNILVFSDEPERAGKYLSDISGNFIIISGNKDYEDLYLMSHCRNIICSPSSFSWWAAYLNKFEDKKIVVPEHWYLPGARAVNNDIFVKGWIRLRAHRPFFDHVYIKFLPYIIRVYYRRVVKGFKILREEGWSSFLLFITKKSRTRNN